MEMKIESVQNAQVRVSSDVDGLSVNALVQLGSGKQVKRVLNFIKSLF